MGGIIIMTLAVALRQNQNQKYLNLIGKQITFNFVTLIKLYSSRLP